MNISIRDDDLGKRVPNNGDNVSCVYVCDHSHSHGCDYGAYVCGRGVCDNGACACGRGACGRGACDHAYVNCGKDCRYDHRTNH